MYKEDEEKTSFITEMGTFCYTVMPFGLKNAEATFQRLVDKVFKEQVGESIEVYVDDLLVISKKTNKHWKDLKSTFNKMHKYALLELPKGNSSDIWSHQKE